MDHVDFTRLFDKHPDAFAASSSFAEFIENAPLEERMKDYLKRYLDGWADRSFLTHKTHGFVARALKMPEARKMSDLFEAVELVEYNGTNHHVPYGSESDGYCYASAYNSKSVSFFGHIAGELYIKIRKDQSFFCYGIRKHKDAGTYAKPKKAVVTAMQEDMLSDRWFSFEFVIRDDGRILVIARDGHHIGSRWLALLDAGESLIPMMSEESQAKIKAFADYDASVKAIVTDDKTVDFYKAQALNVPILPA